MNVMDAYESQLMDKADAACQRIAPLWPIKHFVAVNPYFGLSDQSFWQAHNTLERIAGVGLCMPRAYYREQIASGRITRADLAAALRELGSSWDVPAFERVLARETPSSAAPFTLVTDMLGGLDDQDWSNFVVERISQYCAAYFDEGQALWSMPWRDKSLYSGWLEFTRLDKSPWMMGVRGMGEATTALPDTAQDAIVWALRELAVPATAVDDYLHATLLSVGGWAGWTRYRRWQAELKKGHDDSIRDLLAIRLAWDALLYKLRYSEALAMHWRQAMAVITKPVDQADVAIQVDAVLQTAFEAGYQRQLATSLIVADGAALRNGRAEVQAVFCIDVRSEVYRRALETVAPRVQTLGFAGFFGVLMEYLPFGAVEAKGHLPILFNPSYRICERPDSADARETDKLIVRRHTRMRVANAWKTFKTSASSCFSFVEAVGLLSAPKLVSDSMGWTRPVSHPDRKGLHAGVHGRLGPVLSSGAVGSRACADGGPTGIPEADRPAAAEFALRNMGMIRDFARLVLFVGHGSTTVNNPQATGLDCGACAGQSGEASARIAAALLNDPLTRRGLAQKGIAIPADTYFMACLHDTTTDEVQLFNTDDVPASHTADLAQLRQWLAAAGQITRMERATFLGTGDLPTPTIHADMRRRTRDWAQVRPEWALAGNAAFIAAPRTRTVRCDLAGRAFLHEYSWRNDANFGTLQLIMTAPMIVANWINMQYYGSVVDNRRFGSGNKVLHNVVGGSIGVLEGNGGDLRVGLALQSLHDGARWMHEPMRLNVIIEAPQRAIDDVIARHDMVRELIENEWIHLFQIDGDGNMNRRGADKQWRRY
ncbi:MAG: YbcC family protein, partial [Bacilli bacterium]